MPRRGHKKSRAGCAECKRRHVKCDETYPSCVNCKVASLICSYTKTSAGLSRPSRSTTETPSYSPLTPDTGSVITTPPVAPSNTLPSAISINIDHLELLHHYETLTYKSFTTDANLARSIRSTFVATALQFPFLMYAILALSAMHLCRLHPEHQDRYHSLASSLQREGLARLNDTLLNINEDNCVAAWVFCTTTGLHSFCDTFTFRRHNFNQFLDKLTDCISMMRGVRSVLDGRWWEYLRTTSIGSLLAMGSKLGGPVVDRAGETKPLWDLLDTTDFSAATKAIYEETITTLQRVFNAENRLDHAKSSLNLVFAWPVMINQEYNELLIQRRPEALIILAYYGVVLHHRQETWAVGDAGEFLITSICDYLGRHWERWLVWPQAVISATPAHTARSSPE